jgi:DNA-binding SARP family transcriptional activator
MEFQLLGPVQARADGRLIELGERKQRLVMAVLLLEPNQLVPLGRLVDLLWRESPPSSARRIVQAHVSRLRTALSRVDREVTVVRRGPGYVLTCDPQQVDAHRFRLLLDRAWHSEDARDKVRLLRQALSLWRGPALADAASEEVREELCRGLDEARLAAIEERIDAELRLGRDGQLIDELTELAARHPYRQRFAGQLMLALYRAGRAAEALSVYAQIRQRLDVELGLEPSAELQQLQIAILRADPALDRSTDPVAGAPADGAVVPAQLPADVPDFVGRATALQRLTALSPRPGTDRAGGSPVTIVTGCAGVGKTALAVHWAHQVTDRFGDGQLFIDLQGHAAGPPLRPEQALTSLLSALGTPPAQVPADLADAAALYRTKVAGRRLVVVLDDAGTAEQVRPLLPGTPTCAVVVTSRNRLSSLVAREGARQLSLDVLSTDEAHDLIRLVCGPDRVRGDERAVAELASLCGYLPLALRIATTNVVSGGYASIADYVARILAGDRLDELRLVGDEAAGVTAAFERSYAALPSPAQQLFRTLGAVPGPDCPADAVAVLSGTTTGHADQQLHQLIDANLVEQRGGGRVAMHVLLRCYAERMLAAADGPEHGQQAIQRLLQWYLERTEAAVRGLDLPLAWHPPAEPGRPLGAASVVRSSALSWLETERSNLLALALRAAGEPTLAPQPVHRLAHLLYAAFYRRGSPAPTPAGGPTGPAGERQPRVATTKPPWDGPEAARP